MGTEICELCRKGKIVKSAELMKFRQWSDKGYIRCSAMVMIGVCDSCNVRSLDASAEKILDEAFQREYNKQP